MQMSGVEIQSLPGPTDISQESGAPTHSAFCLWVGYKISFLLGPTDTREGESRGLTHTALLLQSGEQIPVGPLWHQLGEERKQSAN